MKEFIYKGDVRSTVDNVFLNPEEKVQLKPSPAVDTLVAKGLLIEVNADNKSTQTPKAIK